MKVAKNLEQGQHNSYTYRRILKKRFGITLGAYSYGPSPGIGRIPPGTVIGRYCSIARTAIIVSSNHPLDRISTHPVFYDPSLGFVNEVKIDTRKLEIGHDVWIGDGAIILHGCSRIGIGAVVGAGAIVTNDIPDFAIAVGCPARVMRYRFPKNVYEKSFYPGLSL